MAANKNVVGNAISGLATVGEYSALFGIIGSCLIGIILLICGFYAIVAKKKVGIGLLLILIAIILPLISIAWYYFVKSNKGVGAVVGTATIFNLFNWDGGSAARK
jgi:hypothetical protein